MGKYLFLWKQLPSRPRNNTAVPETNAMCLTQSSWHTVFAYKQWCHENGKTENSWRDVCNALNTMPSSEMRPTELTMFSRQLEVYFQSRENS
jgi:hypothetical protein